EDQIEEDRVAEERLERRLIGGALRSGGLEIVDEEKEVHPLHDQEHRDEHPRERRHEEREELALVDRPERFPDALSSIASNAASVVSSANTSSSELRTVDTSRTAQPVRTSAATPSSVALTIAASSSFFPHAPRRTSTPSSR